MGHYVKKAEEAVGPSVTAVTQSGKLDDERDKEKDKNESGGLAFGTQGDGIAGVMHENQGAMYGDDIENGAIVNGEKLAVAVRVSEEDDNAHIPAAVEYDGTAKPSIYKTQRFRLYSLLGLFVMVVVAISAGVGIASTRKEGKPMTKDEYRESLGIREQLERAIGAENLEDDDSPYGKALNWIIHDDPLELGPDDAFLTQRFIMAYFYYATSQKRPWDSCNPPRMGENSTCTLRKLVATSPEIKRLPSEGEVRWLSAERECFWVGVYCDELYSVRAIDLSK